MLAIVVLNVRELMHIFRRIWQDFGPFPLIGCDSEGLVWHFNHEKNIEYKRHELISTSGFVITADQGNLLKDIDNKTVSFNFIRKQNGSKSQTFLYIFPPKKAKQKLFMTNIV